MQSASRSALTVIPKTASVPDNLPALTGMELFIMELVRILD
jgi:hypothetical protein